MLPHCTQIPTTLQPPTGTSLPVSDARFTASHVNAGHENQVYQKYHFSKSRQNMSAAFYHAARRVCLVANIYPNQLSNRDARLVDTRGAAVGFKPYPGHHMGQYTLCIHQRTYPYILVTLLMTQQMQV